MFKTIETKDSSSKETMTFQTNKENKPTRYTNDSSMENGTVMLNGPESPMKPFKGTKSHLEELEGSGSNLISGLKRKADFNDDVHPKKGKLQKYDPSKVMHKLEQFSDVWNDCPDIENPKSSFEIVANNKNEVGIFNNKNFEERTKSLKTINSSEMSISHLSGKAKNSVGKSNRDTNHQDQSTYKQNSKMEITKKSENKITHQVSNDGLTVSGKYDSKLAEMKRKKAVEEQSQLHADQKNIIKKALSSMDSEHKINKKILFSDAEDNEEYQIEVKGDKTKNKKLFEDDDSSDGDLQLKVNSQFEGRKGQKLLELQSKFASDSRFTLDSRFHDSESENEKDEIPTENLDLNEEKKRQLEILESIVKQPIRPLSETRKSSGKRFNESLMVRFDPTREDHEKYLLKPQKKEKEEEVIEKKIKKSKKEKNSLLNVEESKPEVSSEKIYAVKDDLKEVLRKENKTEFSLLKLFGPKDVTDEEGSNIQQQGSESVKKLKYATKNPFRYDSSESEEEDSVTEKREKEQITVKPSLPSWRTTFFFTDSDSRLKEAEEFLKGPEEHEGDQEFAEKRKMLKDFIRHKLKNSNRKKDPFKKKLGGVKKKVFHKKKGK